MHRRKLLDHLADYASRHPQESATTSRFIDFVADERSYTAASSGDDSDPADIDRVSELIAKRGG